MKEEDKELLLKDLCARLPYAIIGLYSWKNREPYNRELTGSLFDELKSSWDSTEDSQFLPYLRPMDSMTEEEKFELKQEHVKDQQLFAEVIVVLNNTEMRDKVIPHFAADWCDKNMFDYRGLIEKGLAIEVTEENNPYESTSETY